jgi:predicted amidophosphoribosyltransferase
MDQVDGHPTPLQYGEGTCTECQRPLSIYNRFVVCGPCRYRLSYTIAQEVEDENDPTGGERTFVWETFGERKPVRRGQLYADTV